MPRQKRALPHERVESWPRALEADPLPTEPDVAVAVAFARNLKAAIGERSTREVGRLTDVDYGAVAKILSGSTWPDMQSVARLEAGLGVDLWPAGVARDSFGGTTK